jgi:hypothetical protein
MMKRPTTRPRNMAVRTAIKAGADLPTPTTIDVFTAPAGDAAATTTTVTVTDSAPRG